MAEPLRKITTPPTASASAQTMVAGTAKKTNYLTFTVDSFNGERRFETKNSVHFGEFFDPISFDFKLCGVDNVVAIVVFFKGEEWFHLDHGKLALNADNEIFELEPTVENSNSSHSTVKENAIYHIQQPFLSRVCEAKTLKVRISGKSYIDLPAPHAAEIQTLCRQTYRELFDSNAYTAEVDALLIDSLRKPSDKIKIANNQLMVTMEASICSSRDSIDNDKKYILFELDGENALKYSHAVRCEFHLDKNIAALSNVYNYPRYKMWNLHMKKQLTLVFQIPEKLKDQICSAKVAQIKVIPSNNAWIGTPPDCSDRVIKDLKGLWGIEHGGPKDQSKNSSSRIVTLIKWAIFFWVCYRVAKSVWG